MKQRILFVDDDANVLAGLRRTVEEYSGEWEVSCAANGRRALEHLLQFRADVVVTDVQMPEMTGLDLLRSIQSADQIKDIPVVILTGMDDRGLKRQALDLGATDLLAKPVDPEDLVARLRSMLHLKEYQDEIKAHNELLQEEVEVRTAALLASQAREQEAKYAAEVAELQNQLTQSKKLESIGLLAAGIAHEINTPMQYIGDNIEYLEKAFGRIMQAFDAYDRFLVSAKKAPVTSEDFAEVETAIRELRLQSLFEDIPDAIRDSKDGILAATRIVQAMKEFSHPGTDEKTPIDINQMIKTTMTVCRNEWKYVASIETNLDNEIPLVSCLPGELKQVLLNIVVNAAHAITEVVGDGAQGKGTISVTTGLRQTWVEIAIKDTGIGIPKDVQGKIFEPFFTTKEVGRGTGQGLSIAHAIVVQKHAGTIWFETEVGKGTTFVIRLPLKRCAAENEPHCAGQAGGDPGETVASSSDRVRHDQAEVAIGT